MKKQIELLKKYGVENYTIENGNITIDGSLYLGSLTSCDKDFLKGTTINGYLYLRSLTSCDKDFLKGTTINGYLYLRSLTSCDKDFLKSTTINGSLDLRSLTSCDKDFLKSTTINGYLDLRSLTSCDKDFLKSTTINGSLYLRSLTSCDKDFLKSTTINGYLDLRSLTYEQTNLLKNNVKILQKGYNKKQRYCFFDGILSKVVSVHTRKEYTIYKTPFEFVVQKGEFTAHGKTIKKAIQDVEFKFIAEKLKHDPIKADTMISVNYYHIVTGACEEGCLQWQRANNLENIEEIRADKLLTLLEKTNAYGLDRFKQLVNF